MDGAGDPSALAVGGEFGFGRSRTGHAHPLDTLAFRDSIPVQLVKVLSSDLWRAVERHKEFYRGDSLAWFFVRESY